MPLTKPGKILAIFMSCILAWLVLSLLYPSFCKLGCSVHGLPCLGTWQFKAHGGQLWNTLRAAGPTLGVVAWVSNASGDRSAMGASWLSRLLSREPAGTCSPDADCAGARLLRPD
jgi:hypothetical protein